MLSLLIRSVYVSRLAFGSCIMPVLKENYNLKMQPSFLVVMWYDYGTKGKTVPLSPLTHLFQYYLFDCIFEKNCFEEEKTGFRCLG